VAGSQCWCVNRHSIPTCAGTGEGSLTFTALTDAHLIRRTIIGAPSKLMSFDGASTIDYEYLFLQLRRAVQRLPKVVHWNELLEVIGRATRSRI
jgi:hypothetical protein